MNRNNDEKNCLNLNQRSQPTEMCMSQQKSETNDEKKRDQTI